MATITRPGVRPGPQPKPSPAAPVTPAPVAGDVVPMPEVPPTPEPTSPPATGPGDHWQRIAEPIARELITSHLDVVTSATGVCPDAVRAILADLAETWGS